MNSTSAISPFKQAWITFVATAVTLLFVIVLAAMG